MGALEWIFSVILAAFGILVFLPRGIFLFRPNAFRTYYDDDPNTSIRTFHRGIVKENAEKIESLGFTELGVKVEKFPLWGSRSEELTFASSKDRAFAAITIYRNTSTYHFITPFTGGQIVITSPGSFKNIDTEGFLSASSSADDHGAVLEKHRESVASFVSKGYTPFQEYTRESRLESSALYYNSKPAKSKARRVGAFTFIAFVVLIFPLIVILTLQFL